MVQRPLLVLALSLLLPWSGAHRPACGMAESVVRDQSRSARDGDTSHRVELPWLVGHWTGEGLGGEVEETWLAPRGGVMLGTFRLVVEGRPEFYELMTITEGDQGRRMNLKHFHPNLHGWEAQNESLDWPELEGEPGSLRFGPVLYLREGADRMRVFVELSEDQTAEFELRRSAL